MNEDSKLLWQQALLQGNAQMSLKVIELKRYQKFGRLVPEMPTDDGVLLRKAMLSEDCIKDLVRPLRDAGWNVEVEEPDEHALYVKVVAKADGNPSQCRQFLQGSGVDLQRRCESKEVDRACSLRPKCIGSIDPDRGENVGVETIHS
jgi:hypothetical protein